MIDRDGPAPEGSAGLDPRPEPLTSQVVVDIARRALWNPQKVSARDIQTLALAVVAHVDARAPGQSPGDCANLTRPSP